MLKKTLAVAQSLAIHLGVAALTLSWAHTPKKKTCAVSLTIKEKPKNTLGPLTTDQQVPKPASNKRLAKKALKPLPSVLVEPGVLEPGLISAGLGLAGDALLTPHQQSSPVLLNKEVSVPYPARAKLMMLEGSVVLRLTISASGTVTKAEVLSGHFDLRKAALRLAGKLQFLPATDEQGLAQIAMVEHEVIFRLKQNS